VGKSAQASLALLPGSVGGDGPQVTEGRSPEFVLPVDDLEDDAKVEWP
jgi:hypothetical protein